MIKRSHLKSDFFKYIMVLMSGTVIAQIINLGLSIVINRVYNPEETAELEMFSRVMAVGAALATAKYELSLPIVKTTTHAYRLYLVGLRMIANITALSFIGVLIPLVWSKTPSGVLFYVLLPLGIGLTAFYNLGTNWGIREKLFSSISYSKVANSSFSGVMKILLGWLGFGYIGLIIGAISGLVVSNVWFLRDFFKARKAHNIGIKSPRNLLLAKQHTEFPRISLPHTLMDLGKDLLVAFMIMEFFTKDDLGYYGLSYRLLRMPLILAGLALSQVFFQRCSEKYNKGEDILPLISKALKVLVLISIVPFTFIFIFGGDIFAFVFSEKWRGAGEFSEIMAPWFLANFLVSPLSFLPIVIGKQREFFQIATIGTFVMILSVFVPAYIIKADVSTMLWAMSLSQVAYFLFVIFKIFQFVKQPKA
ncbi:MAG: lipopolysaccharide biosynthesis protein [Crocinitomicaceae bacterium]|nr:lipopolysaccharide biosynthesis protein [Crocinitomicaceae bacterium]